MATGGALLGFTAGVIIGGALWGNCNWGGGDVNINVNRYNNFNRTNISNGNWKHNVNHRGAVPYRDKGVAQQYRRGQSAEPRRRAKSSAAAPMRSQGRSSVASGVARGRTGAGTSAANTRHARAGAAAPGGRQRTAAARDSAAAARQARGIRRAATAAGTRRGIGRLESSLNGRALVGHVQVQQRRGGACRWRRRAERVRAAVVRASRGWRGRAAVGVDLATMTVKTAMKTSSAIALALVRASVRRCAQNVRVARGSGQAFVAGPGPQGATTMLAILAVLGTAGPVRLVRRRRGVATPRRALRRAYETNTHRSARASRRSSARHGTPVRVSDGEEGEGWRFDTEAGRRRSSSAVSAQRARRDQGAAGDRRRAT